MSTPLEAAYIRAQGRKAGKVAARARRQIASRHGAFAAAEWRQIADGIRANSVAKMRAAGMSESALAEWQAGFMAGMAT